MAHAPTQLDDVFSRAKTSPYWWEGLPAAPTRSALAGSRTADVVIVGAGYTGLWTAYYLTELDPALDVVVIEANHVGYGASGRNGGWCYDGFAADLSRIEAASDLGTAKRFGAALRETVGEVARVTKAEGIDADYHLGGAVEFCRNGGQLERAHHHATQARRLGWPESSARVLGRGEALQIARASDVAGALWAGHTASVHPGRLVHGLAGAAERRGVTIHENTRATRVEPQRVTVEGGATVQARAVLRCTEGYTSELAGRHRELAPFSSTMIATEPISTEKWDEIGLSDRQLFGDLRHMVVYGQRTADDRIAFGGRGAPYGFGSTIRHDAEIDIYAAVYRSLLEIFPQLNGTTVSHRWSGVLGVPRDWFPRVMWDGSFGWAGGYVGAGVAASNLGGRTLAHLVTDTNTELAEFPWVNRPVRRWEREPFRFLGLNTALAVMRSADTAETRTQRPSRRAAAMWRLIDF